jgi:hypothetical protein
MSGRWRSLSRGCDEEWGGASFTDDEFRRLAEIEDGMPIVGTGTGSGRGASSGPRHRRAAGGAAVGRYDTDPL